MTLSRKYAEDAFICDVQCHDERSAIQALDMIFQADPDLGWACLREVVQAIVARRDALGYDRRYWVETA